MFIDKMACTLDALCSWKLANVRATFVSGLYEDICHTLLRMSSSPFQVKCLSKKPFQQLEDLLKTSSSKKELLLPRSLNSTFFENIADIKEDSDGIFLPKSDYFPAIDSIVCIPTKFGTLTLSCNATMAMDHKLTGNDQTKIIKTLAAHFKQPVVLLWLVRPSIFKSFPQQKLGDVGVAEVVQYAVEMSIGKTDVSMSEPGEEKKRSAAPSSTEEMKKSGGRRGTSKRGRKGL